jgi:homoserine kinase type II
MVSSFVLKQLSVILGAQIRFEPMRDHGLSRARVYRLDTSQGIYALKQWPISSALERIDQIHRFQRYLADAGISLVPTLLPWPGGQFILEEDHVHWEISQWKKGRPVDGLGVISDEQLIECAEAIAALHTRSLAYGVRRQVPPGVQDRCKKLSDFRDSSQEDILQAVAEWEDNSSGSEYQSLLRDIYNSAARLAPAILPAVQRLAEEPQTCFWIIRDLWREHFLFMGNRLSGIIDFGAARIDWPIFDLVRALGTMMIDLDPRWKMAIDCYNMSTLAPRADLENVRLLHRASNIVAAIHWLQWLASGEVSLMDRAGRPMERLREIRLQLKDIELAIEQRPIGGS